LLLNACSTVQYYAQSINGQMELLSRREPVQNILADVDTPETLKRQLHVAQQAREFSTHTLGLPDNGSYQEYVDLGRPYVVWAVVAAPEFSLKPKSWCFLVVGCLSYRGYFSQEDAAQEAQQLRSDGLDVSVAGIPAYSTLGWFDDPLLNTMMHWEEHDLVGLIFHELAHQLLYVKGDTAFNESFAMLVEQEGLRRWLCDIDLDTSAQQDMDRGMERYDLYLAQQQRSQDFVQLILGTRKKLQALYAQKTAAAAMRMEKESIFDGLRADYLAYKERWLGFDGYDEWMSQELNNARVVSIAMYHAWVPAFRYMLLQQGGDLEKFYREVGALARLSVAERNERMSTLLNLSQQEAATSAPLDHCSH
jgi:predicted aminopeptidase